MKEFKGTKGKWGFLDDGTYCEIQRKEPLLSICAINTNVVEYEANAKLIASAPEMFEMLNKILDYNISNDLTINEEINELLAKIIE